MNQSATLETSVNEPNAEGKEIEAIKLSIAQYLTEIDQMRELMSRDQIEIDRSQKRSYALLAEIQETISSMNRKAA